MQNVEAFFKDRSEEFYCRFGVYKRGRRHAAGIDAAIKFVEVQTLRIANVFDVVQNVVHLYDFEVFGRMVFRHIRRCVGRYENF